MQIRRREGGGDGLQGMYGYHIGVSYVLESHVARKEPHMVGRPGPSQYGQSLKYSQEQASTEQLPSSLLKLFTPLGVVLIWDINSQEIGLKVKV